MAISQSAELLESWRAGNHSLGLVTHGPAISLCLNYSTVLGHTAHRVWHIASSMVDVHIDLTP